MPEERAGWREIRVGIGVVVALTAALSAFWVGRAGNPFADQYSLVFLIENAKGLHEGAAVRLSGLVVGQVSELEVLGAAPGVGTPHSERFGGMNIRVTIDVNQRFRQEITDRSSVRIASEGVSGMRFVRIEKGPVGGTPLKNGDRIPVTSAMDPEDLLDRAMEVVNRVDALNRYAEVVAAKVKSGGGTLGRFLTDPDDNPVAKNFEEMNLRAGNVMRSLDEGGGVLAAERRTRRIRDNLDRFQSSVEEIQRRVQAGEGTLGAFAADTAFVKALQRLDASAASVQAKVDRGTGSLGRFANDPELLDQLGALTAQLDSLLTQVAKDPLGSVDVNLH